MHLICHPLIIALPVVTALLIIAMLMVVITAVFLVWLLLVICIGNPQVFFTIPIPDLAFSCTPYMGRSKSMGKPD